MQQRVIDGSHMSIQIDGENDQKKGCCILDKFGQLKNLHMFTHMPWHAHTAAAAAAAAAAAEWSVEIGAGRQAPEVTTAISYTG